MTVADAWNLLTGSGEVEESFAKQDQARWEYMLTNIIYTGMFGFSAYYFLTN